MQTLFRNLGFTIRNLSASPGSTFSVLFTMALAIGVNTAIFTVDYATLLAPAPYPHPDRLVYVWSEILGHRNWVSAGDFTDWKRQSSAFEDLNAWQTDSCNIATPDNPEFIDCMDATPEYYANVGQSVAVGPQFLSR